MKISVITVCFNAEATLDKTIKSVLKQSYPEIEYIIIDGGSKDKTIDIIDRYRDKISAVVSEKDNGIYDAMNKGIDLATGEWILFLNSGDLFASEHSVKDMFDKPVSEKVGVLHGDCIYFNEWGSCKVSPSKESYLKCMPVIHPSTFVRATLHKKTHFDSSFRSSGDYDFFYKCKKNGVVFEYRPVTISRFQVGGFATQNLELTFTEDCRIRGGQHKAVIFVKKTDLKLKKFLLTNARNSKLAKAVYKRILVKRGWKEN